MPPGTYIVDIRPRYDVPPLIFDIPEGVVIQFAGLWRWTPVQGQTVWYGPVGIVMRDGNSDWKFGIDVEYRKTWIRVNSPRQDYDPPAPPGSTGATSPAEFNRLSELILGSTWATNAWDEEARP